MDAVTFMMLFVVVCLIGNILYSFYTGETSLSYKMISRVENPTSFWVAIWINVAVIAILVVSALLSALKILD
jgi:hypothetical protein